MAQQTSLITSSARPRSVSGTVMPSGFEVDAQFDFGCLLNRRAGRDEH